MKNKQNFHHRPKKWIFLLLFGLSLFTGKTQNCKEVVGYYPNWQWYDRNKLVNPQSIDYSKYTIINYCFFAPQSDGSIQLTDPWADENLLLGQINWSNGGYYPNTSIVDLAHNAGVKILPSIGGWTLSTYFPSIASDPVKRSNFVQACLNLIQTYQFDGIDLDWEYPGYAPHGGTAQDKQNFNLLLQELRTALDNYGTSINKTMLLTAAVGATATHMNHVDWPVVQNYLDMINLMSYDFFGTWDAVTNHNAPLFAPAQGDPQFNVSKAIENLVDIYGVDPLKINGGVAFYGRSHITLTSPGIFMTGSGLADNSTFQPDQGTPLYYNTIANIHLFDEHWDSIAQVPYLSGKNGLNTFVSYDNGESIKLKAQHFMDKGIGGAIIWEITGDYLETSPGSGVIAGTPLADTLNSVFCNYVPGSGGNGGNGGGSGGGTVNLEEIKNHHIQVYPNPAQQELFIEWHEGGQISWTLMDTGGRIIKQKEEKNEDLISIDINDIKNGWYVLKIRTDKDQIIKQVVVSR